MGVPVIWGTDAVHGHNNLKEQFFPHNIGLGATGNTALVKEISEIVAKEVYLNGLDLTAPAVSVPQNDLWGRTPMKVSQKTSIGSRTRKGFRGRLSRKIR